MPRQRERLGRTPRETAVRIAAAAMAVIVGGLAVTFTIAQGAAGGNVAAAYRLAPYDGRVIARLAASLAGPDAGLAERRRADALARQALRREPMAVPAVSTLALDAQVRGDVNEARRLFAHAESLSRRDQQTQLWAIEDAVGRGDVDGALRHYDIALRTAPELQPLLFGVLAAASADPKVRPALVRTLSGRPTWAGDFIEFAATKGQDLASIAILFEALSRARVAVPAAMRGNLVNNLLARDLPEQAWRYYALIRPGVDRRRSRDPGFAFAGQAPSLFDWTPIDDGGISASIENEKGGGMFVFAAPASVGGPMLQQTQMLPAGTYRLEGHGSGIDQAPGDTPYWLLRCADGREGGRVELPRSDRNGGSFAGTMTVPAGCPVQALVLMARPSNAVAGLQGQIDRLQLVPAGGGR